MYGFLLMRMGTKHYKWQPATAAILSICNSYSQLIYLEKKFFSFWKKLLFFTSSTTLPATSAASSERS